MHKLLMLELNEVNFDFVRAYGERNELPRLNGLIAAHGIVETTSEPRYEEIEPWIQWVSAHTGLTLEEHKVFRLGDIVDRSDLVQIWEAVEGSGFTVGAVSPMNARNACKNARFFIPDPWTQTHVSGQAFLRRFHKAVGQIVNDNAKGRVEAASFAWLAAGLARFARPSNYSRYLATVTAAPRKPWARAMLLDLLLSDLFIRQAKKEKTDFSSLFLNAAAHIQHHYMFNAAVYEGTRVNPTWYARADADPVLDVYRLYDRIVGGILDTFRDHRMLIATGLHQVPFGEPVFYWRLRDHASFLGELDVPFQRVEPRMSRDFVVYCRDSQEAMAAAEILRRTLASDGVALFDVDNRGDSLFVMLSYPHEITGALGYSVDGRAFSNLAGKTSFVALKNGEHNGIGYLIDTASTPAEVPKTVRITDLFFRVLAHFEAGHGRRLAA